MVRKPPDEPQKENPDQLQLDGVQGIEELPKRVDRYGKAKKAALDVADFMANLPKHKARAEKLQTCGDYLAFRHYFTVDQVKLHGARLCRMHLLCPLCAIRRGQKSMAAYLAKWEVLQVQNPRLQPFLVTLTVKDGPDLEERFNHLYRSQRALWMEKNRGRGSVLDGVLGAVWSYEVKRGSNSGEWHPHLHMIALAENAPDQEQLSESWKWITGDSHIVDVRPISQEDPASGFIEVFKYAVKFSDQPPADTVHAWETLAGRRLIGASGAFLGVDVPGDLLDDSEGLEGLPWVTLFYRYLRGGYSLLTVTEGKPEAPRSPRSDSAAGTVDLDRLARAHKVHRLVDERIHIDADRRKREMGRSPMPNAGRGTRPANSVGRS